MSDTTPRPAGLFQALNARIEGAETDVASPQPVMNMMALIELPAIQRRLVRHLLRSDGPVTRDQCAEELDLDPSQLAATVAELTMIGLISESALGLKAVPGWRSSRLPPGGLWSSLADL